MSIWKTRGLRGSGLEELINITNMKYREKGIALVQKVPTPIKPVEINKLKGQITLAYFEQRSTVDYIGVAQGIPLCFDAKESASNTFNMQNIHEHQYEFMKDFEKQGGVSFIIIYFSKKNIYYYLRFKDITKFYERAKKGIKQSFRFEELNPDFEINMKNGIFVHYLDMVNKDLDKREEIEI